MGRDGVLVQLDDELNRVRPQHGRDLLAAWSGVCPLLAGAGLAGPRDVPGWVWRLKAEEADEVLRGLVGVAQGGDQLAATVVLVCLRPGVLALAGQGFAVDELVSELAVVLYEFPLGRRRSVAGQLLLDARKQLVRQAARSELPVDDARFRLASVAAPGELGAGDRVAEQLTELVRDAWKSGRVNADAARLVLLTRVWGEPLSVAAQRMGVNRDAAIARRSRAERRIASALR